ncbi:hypothetical protein NCG97_33810 [Streptomyces lydicamycinicus]|nr:hypothetical protein [Streptomyces lydicamycinicus]USA04460.1 hypothetical protein NCG97_33810 [Streptomyces lydicamycinicus]
MGDHPEPGWGTRCFRQAAPGPAFDARRRKDRSRCPVPELSSGELVDSS